MVQRTLFSTMTITFTVEADTVTLFAFSRQTTHDTRSTFMLAVTRLAWLWTETVPLWSARAGWACSG
jgi:hypothetical protein